MNRKNKTVIKREPLPMPVLTVLEGCQILTIGKSKFYNLLTSGALHYLKLGRRTLIPYSEIQAYLDRLAQQGGAK